MFTIEEINDLHARLGSARTLPEYVRALKALGVERYDSYLADGHSEYFGQGGFRVVSPPVHEVLPVAETGQGETFLQHLRQHERRETTYFEMSRGPGAERDREVDCAHGQDDYDVLRYGRHRDAGRADRLIQYLTSRKNRLVHADTALGRPPIFTLIWQLGWSVFSP
jgi:hypothetical protein